MEEAPVVCRVLALIVEHLRLVSGARLAAGDVRALYGTIPCAQYEPCMPELALLHSPDRLRKPDLADD